MTIYDYSTIYKNENLLGSFLAGLWEGDGHAIIPKTGARPSLHITFNIKSQPLAQKLYNVLTHKCNRISVGSIRYKTEDNACVLNITSTAGQIISLINGKLKTPKLNRINCVIDSLNKKHNTKIKKCPYSNISFSKDAWLAGFIDADGSFDVQQRQKTITRKRKIECRFRLEQRMFDPATGESYELLFRHIAKYLHVKLNIRKQIQTNRSYHIVSMSSAKSKKTLRAYLEKFPLLSSKFLDYKDWCAVDDLIILNQHFIQENTVKQFKASMNNSRTYFNWDHLNHF